MASRRGEPGTGHPHKPLCSAADLGIGGLARAPGDPPVFTSSSAPPRMRRTLIPTLLAMVAATGSAGAQVLDQTLVPGGRLRLQAHGAFDTWDTRFGRAPDGTEGEESLDDDLTDPTTLSLFPGVSALTTIVRDVTGLAGYAPVLGSTTGRVTQDVTRIDFGAHLGIFDWLTVGVVVPWMRTRTALDVHFEPDTLAGNVGVNPAVTNASAVDAFLGSTASARTAAAANATSLCAGGATPECVAAQALADRVGTFHASLQTAYTVSPFFPLTGTASGDALAQTAATLSADLAAAGLTTLAPVALSDERLTAEGLALLPSVTGAGFEAAPLQTRRSLWGTGDVEVSARVRLLGNLATSPDDAVPGFGYRVTGSFLARLPTGAPADPDIFFDLGLDDAQTDYEGGLHAALRFGQRVGLTMGGYYGVQGATTITRRVVPPEQIFAPVETRRELRWEPGFYTGFGAALTVHLASALTLAPEYRFFHKGRDEFALLMPDPSLDPVVLAVESGVKAHMVGGGIRYDTVLPWQRGEAPRALEVHVRLLTTVAGSGGQVPKTTRVEAGARVFRRLWGEER